MKRAKNEVEQEFDKLADACSVILYRAMLLFPPCVVGAGVFIYKICAPWWIWSESVLLVIGFLFAWTTYSLLVMFIYEDSINKHLQKICRRLEHQLILKGEIDNPLKKRKLIRDIQHAARGRVTKKMKEYKYYD